MPPDADVTQLLRRSQAGDADAHAALFEELHGTLRGLASRLLSGERAGHTLQPTALVHEAWFKLAPGGEAGPLTGRDRGHFLAIAARAMRQVLVNHARDRQRLKRRGPEADQRVTLSAASAPEGLPQLDVLALHESLERLAELDERQHAIVELRVFAGLSVAEAAEALGVSERTVKLDWSMARRWLAGALGGEPDA